jgi:tRNA pseudouridine55 synthase
MPEQRPPTAAGLSGLLVVDKPVGITSFDVVAEVRRMLRVRRAGHGGTLDPLASGVLPVAVGEGTKLLGFLLAEDKEYEAEATLGTVTDTLDAEGQVVARADPGAVTAEGAAQAVAALRGVREQRPPMWSAVRQDGVRLYERARRGEVVERAARTICVQTTELLGFDLPRLRFRVACSKGTYVRVLVAELGEALGCGAHLSALRRTRSGRWAIADAVALGEVGSLLAAGRLPLRSPADALEHLATAVVDAALERRVRAGQHLRSGELFLGGGLDGGAGGGAPASADADADADAGGAAGRGGRRFRVLAESGRLVAVGELVAAGPRGGGGDLRWLRIFN